MRYHIVSSILLSGALACLAPTLLAQADINVEIQSSLPIEMYWIDDALGLSKTAVDFPEGESSFQIHSEDAGRMKVSLGNETRVFVLRDGYGYAITAGDSSIVISSLDPYHESLDRASAIFREYDLYKIPDNELLQNLEHIRTRLDSIKSAHPDDKYLHQTLDYYWALRSITPCIQSKRSATVSTFVKGLEKEFVINQQDAYAHPMYCNFLTAYYGWKYVIKDFSDYKAPKDTESFDRFKGELALIGNDTIEQLAMLCHLNDKYKGEGSNRAEAYRAALVDIQNNPSCELIAAYAVLLKDRMDQLSLGFEITDFEFHTTDSATIRIGDFRDIHYILLDFWFVGCSPCKRDIPSLKALHHEFAETLCIIAVNPLEPIEKVSKYKATHDIPYHLVIPTDPSGIRNELNVRAYPTYILLNPQGEVALFAGSDIDKVRGYMESVKAKH